MNAFLLLCVSSDAVVIAHVSRFCFSLVLVQSLKMLQITCRKHSEDADDDIEHQSPAKRERTAYSSKYCRMCKCRLELAVREIGKCKCGMFV